MDELSFCFYCFFYLEPKREKETLQANGVSEGEQSCGLGSSISIDTHQPFLGEFGVENAQDFLHIPENHSYICGMEWWDMFGLRFCD